MPNLKFVSVSMDFIVGLPKTQNNFNRIVVVVDRLTKIAHFILIVTTVTAYRVVGLFMREFFKHHGLPREL